MRVASDDQQSAQAVEAHFEKELQLVQQHRRQVIPEKIKPLTLFFIEKVDDYVPVGSKLRTWFEEEYERVRANGKFRALEMPDLADVHDGYFAVDRKGVAKAARADSKDAADAFERMQRKQDLLGFEEPLRFIFSHSALAEGWDNPNVFTLNLQDGSTMRKRQHRSAVGYGSRWCRQRRTIPPRRRHQLFLTVIASRSPRSPRHCRRKSRRRLASSSRSDHRREQDAQAGAQGQGACVPGVQGTVGRSAPQTNYRLDFSTEAVVSEAVRRINEMPSIQPVSFGSHGVIRMGSDGLTGTNTADLGEVDADGARRMPDVVGELCRSDCPSRAPVIVRILRGVAVASTRPR